METEAKQEETIDQTPPSRNKFKETAEKFKSYIKTRNGKIAVAAVSLVLLTAIPLTTYSVIAGRKPKPATNTNTTIIPTPKPTALTSPTPTPLTFHTEFLSINSQPVYQLKLQIPDTAKFEKRINNPNINGNFHYPPDSDQGKVTQYILTDKVYTDKFELNVISYSSSYFSIAKGDNYDAAQNLEPTTTFPSLARIKVHDKDYWTYTSKKIDGSDCPVGLDYSSRCGISALMNDTAATLISCRVKDETDLSICDSVVRSIEYIKAVELKTSLITTNTTRIPLLYTKNGKLYVQPINTKTPTQLEDYQTPFQNRVAWLSPDMSKVVFIKYVTSQTYATTYVLYDIATKERKEYRYNKSAKDLRWSPNNKRFTVGSCYNSCNSPYWQIIEPGYGRYSQWGSYYFSDYPEQYADTFWLDEDHFAMQNVGSDALVLNDEIAIYTIQNQGIQSILKNTPRVRYKLTGVEKSTKTLYYTQENYDDKQEPTYTYWKMKSDGSGKTQLEKTFKDQLKEALPESIRQYSTIMNYTKIPKSTNVIMEVAEPTHLNTTSLFMVDTAKLKDSLVMIIEGAQLQGYDEGGW